MAHFPSLVMIFSPHHCLANCDSNSDLPRNWRDIEIKEAFGSLGGDVPNMETNAESADEGISSDDGEEPCGDEDFFA